MKPTPGGDSNEHHYIVGICTLCGQADATYATLCLRVAGGPGNEDAQRASWNKWNRCRRSQLFQTEDSSAAQLRGREAASMQRSVGPNKPF